jgi:adenylate cyclase
MEADERGTIARQKSHRTELIDPEIAAHNGRIVKTMGDGLLVEFASVVDATECAVAIQRAMADREGDVPEERRIQYRVGVNLGDIVIDGDDILGDGVNVAARLESLAEPGGICIAGSVREQLASKVALEFEDMGEQRVKNILRPIRAYRVRWSSEAPTAAAAVADVSAAVPGFQGRPAIAVLPFDNLSGDPEQEFFVDGIAEDILTRLAMWRWLPVIARNSSFTYKGRAVDLKQVGKELGARYVLEGSVRRAGSRVRVTAQLIDTATGHHVWAERYDRELEDIFAVQDEITDSIVAALEPAVGKAETQRARAKEPENLDAWETVQRGLWHVHRFNREDLERAVQLFRDAVRLDPNFALAHSMFALGMTYQVFLSWSDDPAAALAEAGRESAFALSLDDMDPTAHTVKGFSSALSRQYDAALESARRALELNPSFAMGYFGLGGASMFAGDFDGGVEANMTAIRLSPHDPWLPQWLANVAVNHYMARRYEDGLEYYEKSRRLAPDFPLALRGMASCLAQLGCLEEAREALREFLRLVPAYSDEGVRLSVPFRDPAHHELYLEGLRKAGWDG